MAGRDDSDDLQRFAVNAIHDLRQPLQVICGFAQLLAGNPVVHGDQRARDHVAFIERGAATMSTVVDNTLAYLCAAQPPMPGLRTDVASTVATVLTQLEKELRDVRVVVDDSLPTLPGDETQLRTVFRNLILNAVQFRGDSPPTVEVTAEPAEEAWVFRVTDNGAGIPPDMTERIFVPFERLDREGRRAGAGLGLAVCKRVVEQHGGTITLERPTAQGSTFVFTLPALPADVGAASPAGRTDAPSRN